PAQAGQQFHVGSPGGGLGRSSGLGGERRPRPGQGSASADERSAGKPYGKNSGGSGGCQRLRDKLRTATDGEGFDICDRSRPSLGGRARNRKRGPAALSVRERERVRY